MRLNFGMSIDADKVKVTVTRDGKKPEVIYSAKGQGAIGIGMEKLAAAIQNIKKAFIESARKSANRTAEKAAEKTAKKKYV